MPGEDESLGLTKFDSPKLLLTSKKTVDRHLEMLEMEIIQELFKSDAYLMDKAWAEEQEKPLKEKNPANGCKCLDGFYTEHSLCS